MADDDIEELDEDASAEGEEGEGGAKKGGKKKLLIIGGVVLLLLIGGAAAAYFTGLFSSLGGGGEASSEHAPGAPGPGAVFFDLPELLVNLNTGGRKSTFLKIRISLELDRPEDVPRVEALMPRIVDNFQVYLRELRIDDLKGSAGMYRLREELLRRVAAAVAPTKVNDVLFKEMLVQ